MLQQKNLTDENYLNIWNTMVSLCRNPEDCWFGNHPTLRDLNLQTGVKAGQGIIAIYLNLLNVVTNYKLKLNEIQISMLSQMIYEKFFYLKVTEIILFFHDYFKYLSSDKFFGSIEFKTIMDMLTNFVREKRGKAIWQHDEKLHTEHLEKEKSESIDWQQYCEQKGVDFSDSPIEMIKSNFGRKLQKDTPESMRKSAEELVYNRWGLDEAAMEYAYKSFMARYKCTPEYVLGKRKE